jgi:hypothetical protein
VIKMLTAGGAALGLLLAAIIARPPQSRAPLQTAPSDTRAVSVPAPTRTLPRLVARGHVFALESGARFTAIEASDFHLLGRYVSGADIRPVLQQRADLGFNMLRVWTRYDLTRYGIGRLTLADHPDLYERIPAFLDLVSRYGLYVEFTAYTGREDFDPAHWRRLGDALEGSTAAIVELVNEADQPGNRIDLARFRPLAGVFSSHGSNGSEQRPVRPFWTYATFHTNGAKEWWRKNGYDAMQQWNGPTLTNESTRCPDQDAEPRHFEDAAASAALLAAGSALHTVHGKNSELFDPAEVACARAHVRGAKSVNLMCQDGEYRHRVDLESAGDLRVFERRTPGVDCVVRVRR